MTVSTLPRIIAITGRTDAGEFGATSCPHCGAQGRYITHFVTENGTIGGAMSGCLKLFPISPLADIHAKLLAKKESNIRKGWKPFSGFDQPKIDAIEACMRGELTEAQAIWVCKEQSRKAAEWMRNRRSGR